MQIKLFLKIFLPILIIFIITGVVSGYTIFSQIRESKIEKEKEINYNIILNQARSSFTKDSFEDSARFNGSVFEDFFQKVRTDEFVNMEFWSNGSMILYSLEKGKIGRLFPNNEEFRAALGGETNAEIKTAAQLAQKYGGNAKDYSEQMEIYIPITFENDPGQVAGVIEAYIDFSSANKEINSLTVAMVMILAASALFLLIAIFLTLKYYIVKPLDSLVKVANNISLGKWKQRADIKSRDEIGILAKVFNKMLDSIETAGKKLKEEHEETQAIISSMGEGLLVLDRDLNIISMNKAAEKSLEISLEKCRGLGVRKILTLMRGSENLPIEEYPARRMLKTGKTVTIGMKDNFYYKCASGKIFPVEIVTAPFMKDGLAGAIVLFKDVSDMKQMEEDKEYARINLESALKSVYIERDIVREQKNKLEAILNSIGDAVFAVDKEEKIFIFNSAAEKITGFKVKEVKGRNYKNYLRFSDEITKKEKNAFIDEALKGKQVLEDNHTVLEVKDKNPINIDETTASIRNSKGEIIGCIVVFKDVTNRREVERMRSDFISIASHQLRTPLSGIKWFLEILLSGDMGKMKAKQLTAVKEIYENNQNMIDIVNKMLNMSRIENNRLLINPEKINLSEILNKIVSDLKPITKKKGQKLELYELKDGNVEIFSDKVLLENILNNLITNASKYTPDGGMIKVSVKKQDKCNLLFKVKDNGIGIPKKEQYKIFNKFFRAGNAISYEANGTGIGLYIAKSILKVIGGDIWFESKENKGTAFSFTIPINIGSCKL